MSSPEKEKMLDRAAELQAYLEKDLGLTQAVRVTAFYLYRHVFGDETAKSFWGRGRYAKNMFHLRRASRRARHAQTRRRNRVDQDS
jgi:hypothetical protein